MHTNIILCHLDLNIVIYCQEMRTFFLIFWYEQLELQFFMCIYKSVPYLAFISTMRENGVQTAMIFNAD